MRYLRACGQYQEIRKWQTFLQIVIPRSKATRNLLFLALTNGTSE
jgi:hypothetical protein